jgi:hypothetical protein
MKDKKIKFGSIFPYLIMPKPAKTYIPDWYKKADRFIGGEEPVIHRHGGSNRGLKLCIGFIDGMTSGYIAELPQDVYVSRDPFGITWKVEPEILSELDPGIAHTMPRPAGHMKNMFGWNNLYVIQTPPGYSCVITHPLNRHDLPFTTTSGILDSDGVLPSIQTLPFFLKEDFEGVIPAGTPIFQIIPFKRENWVSEKSDELGEASKESQWLSTRVIHGWYKKAMWKKKSYN